MSVEWNNGWDNWRNGNDPNGKVKYMNELVYILVLYCIIIQYNKQIQNTHILIYNIYSLRITCIAHEETTLIFTSSDSQ